MRVLQAPDRELCKNIELQNIISGMEYRPSQFVLRFTHKGREFLFHTMTRELLEGVLPERCRAGEGWDSLIESSFLVPAGTDECAFYQNVSALMRRCRKKEMHRLYTILPTSACNARCAYCYGKDFRQAAMTPETVRHTIEYILNSREGGRVRIKWVGGEPLLCPGIIDEISLGLREAGVEYKSTMISNGSLVTPGIVRKMREDWNLKQIQISMDGCEADCIARKRYPASQDAYRSVMEGINLLTDSGIRVIVRCNVDEENWNGIPAFLNDLKAVISDRTNVWVYFAPLFQVRCGKDDLALWKKIIAARSAIEEAGFRVKGSLMSESRFRIFHCMADGGNVTINSDGDLYACGCLTKSSRFGNVQYGVTDEDARRLFCSVERVRKKCRHCPFLPECTAFDNCPYRDTHCRELREMEDLSVLKRIVEKDGTAASADDSRILSLR